MSWLCCCVCAGLQQISALVFSMFLPSAFIVPACSVCTVNDALVVAELVCHCAPQYFHAVCLCSGEVWLFYLEMIVLLHISPSVAALIWGMFYSSWSTGVFYRDATTAVVLNAHQQQINCFPGLLALWKTQPAFATQPHFLHISCSAAY